jgi:2-dehydro-3-deoxygluconokinase
MNPIDVLAIGEPLIEFNQLRAEVPEYLQGYGGDTSNLIVAAARTGARTGYVTRVGDDPFGCLLRELWRAEGIDAGQVAIDPQAYTGAYFVTHGRDGHRFSYLRAGSAASRMRPSDLPPDLLARARCVHASGISMAISASAADTVLAAFEQARSGGARVSFDPNLRLRLWPLPRARALIRAALALADYCFASLEDMRALLGERAPGAMIDWLHEAGAATVFLKLGPRGVIASDGRTRTAIAGHCVAAVDATGAGDCFGGAALARMTGGDDALQAARYANAAAALATTGYGAVAPLPRPEAVARLLRATGTPGPPER